MGLKVTNNAFGTLNAGINSSVTTVVLAAGQGALFPTLTAGDYFYATLIDTSNNLEIVKVTARSTDTMTIVRGQDNTTARAYSTNDRFELRPTAILFNEKANANEYLPLTGGALTGSLGVGTSTLTNKLNVAGAIQSNSTLAAIEANTVAMSQESGYARIAAFGANSSTPGVLDLTVISTNGAIQKGARIDSSGRLTKPYQPAFKVVRNDGGGNVTTEATIPFNYAHLNLGSHFNLSTYTFTAPVTGYYFLAFGGMNHQANPGGSLFRLYINGVQKSYWHLVNSHPSSASYSAVYYMSANDTAYCTGGNYHYGDGPNGYDYPYFSGYLLG